MKYNFSVKQSILHKNGYREKERTSGREYYKQINGSEFPRFHLKLENDGTFSLHIDENRRHGSFMRWVFGGKKNIINNNEDIRREAFSLRLDLYDEVLDGLKSKILEIRGNINKFCK